MLQWKVLLVGMTQTIKASRKFLKLNLQKEFQKKETVVATTSSDVFEFSL